LFVFFVDNRNGCNPFTLTSFTLGKYIEDQTNQLDSWTGAVRWKTDL